MGKSETWPLVLVLAVAMLVCRAIGERADKCYNDGCCLYNQYTVLKCYLTEPEAGFQLNGEKRLREFRIDYGKRVRLYRNAVANKEDLHTLLFSDIRELILEPNSKSQVGPARIISMTISQVDLLRLKTDSFFGWYSNAATLSVGNVKSCRIASAAFPTTTGMKRVLFENITSLTVEPGAFLATIEELAFRNVSTLSCVSFAFGGSVDHLSLSSVTVDSLKSRCFDAGLGRKRLTVTSSDVGHISRFNVQDLGVDAADQRHAEEPTLSIWWSYLGVSSLTLLLLAAAALLINACRRHLAGRRRREDAGTDLQLREVDQSHQSVTSGLAGMVGHDPPGGPARSGASASPTADSCHVLPPDDVTAGHDPPGGPARSGASASPTADSCHVLPPDDVTAYEEEPLYCEIPDVTVDRRPQGGSGQQARIDTTKPVYQNIPRSFQ